MKMLMVLIHVWHRFFSVFCEASSTVIAQNAKKQKNIVAFAVIEHHGGFGCNPLIS